jgi:uncharacterized protein (DUF362 family)/Pyruvate/2-oxoacid:ferredoxin oxidoreductase delta subunit
MKSKVAVVRCDSYQIETVSEAVTKGIDLLGGISAFTQAGENILFKPNLLVGDRPEKSSTTHPMVFQAVSEAFKGGGANLFYGDSPGKGNPERTAQQAGLKDVADKLGITLADFRAAQKVSHPNALLAKQLMIAKGAMEADGIVSICKMKTHGFTRITGAVKNQFGCIPGLRKAEYHVKMPDIYEFSKVLVDINTLLKPRLYIMDGIIAMEGNGPRGGEPVPMNTLLFSSDPVALDAVFCQLIHLKPEFVPTMKLGLKAGLGTYKADDIEIIGDNIDGLKNAEFKAVHRKPDRLASARYFPTFLKNIISPRPVIDYETCVNCGACILQCPVDPKALNWQQRTQRTQTEKPVYNYKDCIRCYCCQEICPEKAITIKTPFLGRLIYR